MANRNVDLAGYSDPEVPGWQQRAMDRVRERQAKTRKGQRKNGLYLFFDDPFRVLLDEAARRRGISMVGYLRRAAAAMIAHDLGVEFTEVARHAAQPRPYGGLTTHGLAPKTSYDNGEGHGDWVIERLKGGL